MSVTKMLKDFPKPYPYHKAMKALLETGKPVGQLSSAMNALASNSGAHGAACNGSHSYHFMDGMLAVPAPEFCSAQNPACTNVVVTRKEQLHGKYLIMIPCNSGAMVGDYFTKNTWATMSKYFPERMTCVDFAATDSITTVSKDGKGLIVFETEMHRVKGFDLFPTYSPAKLVECIANMRVSLPRLAGYKHVIVFLNVRLYKEAVLACALPNMTFVDLQYKQGFFLQGIPALRELFETLADPEDLL